MPDDELEGSHEELVEDALLTEVLMGWDGDPCECRACRCGRFAGADPGDRRCDPCRRGEHNSIGES